jgi:hypothetical protein
MLTPKEFKQLQIALFSMHGTKVNGEIMISYDNTLALLKSYTEGELVIEREGTDGLNVAFTPKE